MCIVVWVGSVWAATGGTIMASSTMYTGGGLIHTDRGSGGGGGGGGGAEVPT